MGRRTPDPEGRREGHWWKQSQGQKMRCCQLFSFLLFSFSFFPCRAALVAYIEVSGLGVKSELQLLAYTTATVTPDLSCVCDLHHSSQQCLILNALSWGRNRTRIFMDTSWFVTCWATMGTPKDSWIVITPFQVLF